MLYNKRDAGSPKRLFTSPRRPWWLPTAAAALWSTAPGLAYLLYASICCTSPVNCVLMLKRLRLHIQSTQNTAVARPAGWTPLSGAERACLCSHACARRSEANEWLSVALPSAFQLPRGWHVGGVAGASFTDATSRLCPKQVKSGFWKIEEASRWLWSQHSTTHSIAQWCRVFCLFWGFFFFSNPNNLLLTSSPV